MPADTFAKQAQAAASAFFRSEDERDPSARTVASVLRDVDAANVPPADVSIAT